MKTKHTQGPWMKKGWEILTAGFKSLDGKSGTLAGYEIAIIKNHPNTIEQDEANAHLISAAPEMLEALKKMSYRCNDFETSEWLQDPLGELVLSAIRKAEGRK